MYIEVKGRQSGLVFSACHFIVGHGKCGRMHGHNYHVELRLHADELVNHMVCDFVIIKKLLRTMCDRLDHLVLVPNKHPDLKMEDRGAGLWMMIDNKEYLIPKDDIILLDSPSTSSEDLAILLLEQFFIDFDVPNNITKVELGVFEQEGQGAWVERTI